ncbi:MAG: hypothetical protein M0Z28_18170 [Rhodospirillales bacterium]|nr:hypothetical protein [Rhodospirillales bacterium]
MFARNIILPALLLAPLAAQAQQPPAKPDMALLPRAAVEAAIRDVQAIATLHPDLATPAVQEVFGALAACLADNPVQGRLTRQGTDQCPAVTESLAAQKALADARKPAEKPAPHAQAAEPKH